MTFEGASFNLQYVLATASLTKHVYSPHHPISCSREGHLWYEEDGTFRCAHTTVDPDDPRTMHCVNHSIAILILESARCL